MVWGFFSLLVPVMENLKTTVCNDLLDDSVLPTLWNSLGKALSCFSMTITLCTKQVPYRNGLLRSVWKNLTGLYNALTSTKP